MKKTVALFLMTVFAATAALSEITIRTFVGHGTPATDWNVAANWAPAGVPDNDDVAVIASFVRVSSPDDIAGNVVVRKGGNLTFDTDANTLTVTGNVLIEQGGQISFVPGVAGTLRIQGGLVNFGGFAATGGTVEFYGSGPHILTGTNPIQFYNLTVLGGKDLTIICCDVTYLNILTPADLVPKTLLGSSFARSDTPLPVTLVSFDVTLAEGARGVHAAWSTASEIDNYGFYLERAEAGTENWVSAGFVPTKGNGLVAHDYELEDASVTAGQWIYRLRQVDNSGAEHISEPKAIEVTAGTSTAVAEMSAPVSFGLQQNYPNPFNPTTTVRFAVKQSGAATVQVYNATGQLVATLFEGMAVGGQQYTLRFDATRLASGTYFCRMQSGSIVEMKKMLLVR